MQFGAWPTSSGLGGCKTSILHIRHFGKKLTLALIGGNQDNSTQVMHIIRGRAAQREIFLADITKEI